MEKWLKKDYARYYLTTYPESNSTAAIELVEEILLLTLENYSFKATTPQNSQHLKRVNKLLEDLQNPVYRPLVSRILSILSINLKIFLENNSSARKLEKGFTPTTKTRVNKRTIPQKIYSTYSYSSKVRETEVKNLMNEGEYGLGLNYYKEVLLSLEENGDPLSLDQIHSFYSAIEHYIKAISLLPEEEIKKLYNKSDFYIGLLTKIFAKTPTLANGIISEEKDTSTDSLDYTLDKDYLLLYLDFLNKIEEFSDKDLNHLFKLNSSDPVSLPALLFFQIRNMTHLTKLIERLDLQIIPKLISISVEEIESYNDFVLKKSNDASKNKLIDILENQVTVPSGNNFPNMSKPKLFKSLIDVNYFLSLRKTSIFEVHNLLEEILYIEDSILEKEYSIFSLGFLELKTIIDNYRDISKEVRDSMPIGWIASICVSELLAKKSLSG